MPATRSSPLGLTSNTSSRISPSIASKPTRHRSSLPSTLSPPSKSKPQHHRETLRTPSKSTSKPKSVSKPTRRSTRLCSPTSKAIPKPKAQPKPQPRITIHLLRHAHSTCNLPLPPHQLLSQLDPHLTPLGITQATHLAHTFPHHSRITHILCSPMQRAINTAVIAFEPVLKRGVKISLWNELREYGDSASATGTEVGRLKELHGEGEAVDYSRLSENWEKEWSMDDDFKAMPLRILRGIWALADEARERGEVNGDGEVEIVVVSHGWLLASLVGGGELWGNAERRTYGLEGGKGWRRLVRIQDGDGS